MVVVGCQPLAGESMRWIKDTVTGLANPHDAAAKNRVSKMEKYVQQGGDVNKPNKLGDTPLHEACAYIRENGDSSKGKRRKAIAKDRRKVGKKLSRRQLGEGGALEMLELLVNAGSDINAQNIVGDAPLHKAALNGRARSADFLIRAGANVNIRNEFAQTPLHAACVSGNIEVVQRLVQGGADTSAQDAAEDTPFYEACRHQYEGIVVYLMGLVDNPDTKKGLKLWQGLDPSWEKMLRSRAQAQVEDAEERGEKPATVTTAAAAAGLSSVRLGISTPSTTHNSLRSSESAMGLGLANRTPVRQGQFATTGGRERGGITVSVRGSEQDKKLASTSPGALQARGGGGDARRRSAESGAAAAAAAAGGARMSSDGIDFNSTGGSRPGSAARRRRRDGGAESTVGHSRSFSTGAADVLDWQATKAKSAQQERLIDKAREALREEQNEAAMAMSSTTLGDDDGSVDTINTADTPTTIGSRNSRPRSQRVPSGGKASPAAVAAAAGAGRERDLPFGPRRGNAPSRNGASAAAVEGAEREHGSGKATMVSPVMPTPPRSEVNVDTLAPPRELGRRLSARKSRGRVVALKSPVARVSRRSSGGGGGGGGGGSSKPDNVDGSSSSNRRPSSRRSGAPRASGDHRPEAGVGGPDGNGRDPQRSSSRRSSAGRSSRPSAGEHEGHGHGSSSSAAVADSPRSRPRSSRRREHQGERERGGEDTSRGGENGREGRGEPRSPSSRRERHRQREGGVETAGRSSPRVSGGSSRRGHRSSQESNPNGAGGSSTSRRRESQRQSRSSHEGAAPANGHAAAGAVSTSAVPAQSPAPGGDAAAATATANGLREVPGSVAKAVKTSHEARTPRKGDSMSAHFMTHGTPRKTRGGRPTPSKSREGRPTPLRPSEGRDGAGRTPSAAREGRTPSASSGGSGREGRTPRASRSGSRPATVTVTTTTTSAQKQRSSGGRDLRPPTWASTVSSGLEEAASRKKVIASDLPVRRVSPYNAARKQESLGADGGPARVQTVTVTSKHFFTSPGRPAASRPVAKTIDLRGDKGKGNDNDNDSCSGSSFGPAARAGHSGVGSSAASRPVAKTIDLRGDGDHLGMSNSSDCGSSFDLAGRTGAGSNGRRAAAAKTTTSPRRGSPPRTPTLSVDEDFPPLIDALMMGDSAAASGGWGGSQRPERAHKDEGNDKKVLKDEKKERVSPATASKSKRPAMTEIAIAKSKSLLFSDSDSDSDNGRSSSGEASEQAASTFGDAESIAALSAVSNVFRQQGHGDKGGKNEAALDDTQVERAMEDHADSAASFVVFTSNRKTDAAAAASETPVSTTPTPPPPAASPASTVAVEAASRAEVAPAGPGEAGPSAVDGPAATAAAAAQAVHGKSSVVEPSAAPRVSVEALSSTQASQMPAGGVGGAKGRPPSALGRPGMAPAKVPMPIAGGRAAWNKFLASSAPGEAASDAPGASTAEPSADNSCGQSAVPADGGSEEGDSAAAAQAQDELLAARGPRGFKSAADSQEGPNKGPAGAFSGNAMWRLTAGASSAANRARSGVAANGHGGYSNPLAAMRAGGNGAASSAAADGTPGGGGVANPLAGLRGAASMGGAGTANPLARVRGRGARPGGAGGIANPMLRGGGAGGTANPLARGSAASGGALSSGAPVSAAAKEPALPSGGGTAVSAAASPEDVADAAPAGGEGVASTSTGEKKQAATDGAIDLDRPTEFRAIGNNGSWHKGGIPIPPRRSTRAQPQVEADPGQAKVGGLVMALQNTSDSRFGPMLKDLRSEDSSSTSSLTVLDKKGLVSLHRAKYSPRPPRPGMPNSNGLDA